MEVLAIIPARGGSKGLPRKNVLPLCGRPLVAHSIMQARDARAVTRTVVSTDDDEIAEVATASGADVVRRPAEISGDEATSELALLHVLDTLREVEDYEPELVVFMQCTSPLRGSDDVDSAIARLVEARADSLLSVSPSHRFIWTENEHTAVSINYDYRNRPRRQDMSPQYVENGSLYVFKPEILRGTGNRLGGVIALHVMHAAASQEIDDRDDFEIVAGLFRRHHADQLSRHG